MPTTPKAPALPSPSEILERENSQRRVAIVGALIAAVLVAIAVVIEQIIAGKAPTGESAVDLIEAVTSQATGKAFPPSFWTEYAQFKVDHAPESIAIATLRGVGILLLLPIVLFLLRAARERGGTLKPWLEPVAGICIVVVGVLMAVEGVLDAEAYRASGPDYMPTVVVENARNQELVIATFIRGIVSFGIGVPVAFAALQAMRMGLLSRVLGFMGVLVGIVFIIPLDSSGLIRAFWFAAVAGTIAGKIAPSLSPGWKTGTAVAPEPRLPPPPRGAKAAKGGKGGAGKGKPEKKTLK